jgi:indolepyruvate ferredoxin oxidoreductase
MNAPVAPQHLTPELHEALGRVTLDDKYTLDKGRAYMNGTQALVRLLMLQHERDLKAGLNTAGFVSGYRGSPLGSVDQTLWKAKKYLEQHHIAFQPGLNEDIAATSVWGSQQVNMSPHAKYDGVFGMWYGKGPGVDRSGDVFKHANAAGTSKHGGVLVLAGDDHSAKSSTFPHQSDHILKACGIPVFFPSTVQEYLDLGLHAYAMSRYSGLWCGFKVVTDVVEASASVIVDPDRVQIKLPEDFVLPADGLNIRWPDSPLEQEARLMDYKFYAALAYVRANRLNHTVWDSPHARFGIMASGKAYLDTRQALMDLGLGEAECARFGIRLFKVGVVWPLDAYHVREFATGLQEILVVEEKRQMIEYQLKEELYNFSEHARPRVFGKFDDKEGGEWAIPQGNWLLPAKYELSPAKIAKAIASRLANFELPSDVRARIDARLAIIHAKESALALPRVITERKPFFCSGCPHNTSTRVPEGSRAVAGIGCHYMTVWMPDRRTETFTQMGGEGTPWIGQAPFTNEKHIFANLGDGTYFHSGILAIRASIAAKVNITYKILFNDAVAMTGGQATDGSLTVPQISRQMAAEGAKKIIVVTDEPEKYDGHWDPSQRVIQNEEGSMAIATGKKSKTLGPMHDNHLAHGVTVHHRDELDKLQRELREIEGTTILIYDQTCASEKRRRRKKIVDGKPLFPDPAKRVFINDLVCEGCGDCSVQSNCLSVEPLETEFGRKRVINQSSCNKDFSCVKGFCPSFVTVEGGRVKKGKGSSVAGAEVDRLFDLPQPVIPEVTTPYGILVMGVGGTGVVTIGQLLGMAGHLENKGVSVLDMAGLAQKGGEVASHVQIAATPERLQATRIATGEADLVLGCELIVTGNTEAISKMQAGKTRAVVNTSDVPTAEFVRNPDWKFPGSDLAQEIRHALGADRPGFEDHCDLIDANKITVALMGDALYTNPFMLGYAWQKGWIPLTEYSIIRAIELNAVSVDANKKAFTWGRRAAHDRAAVERVAFPAEVVELKRDGSKKLSGSLDETIARRAEFLVGYQNAAYAGRYMALVDKTRAAEMRLVGASTAKPALPLTEAVARYYFKLLAYKDEYEVARLYTDPAFMEKIHAQFEADDKHGPISIKFNLAPPMFSKRDDNGHLIKKQYGPWMMKAFGVLAKMKGLRGTALDVFGRTAERVAERALIVEYESTITMMLAKLDASNLDAAIAVARIPEEIRGYGHVKEANMKKAAALREALVSTFKAPVKEISRARAA